MPLRVLILVNRGKEKAVASLSGVSDAVQAHATLIDTIDALNPQNLPSAGEVDLVIALGGDGTILRTAHLCLTLKCPLLGVNTGKVGFMAGYELDSFLRDAPTILDPTRSLTTREVHPITAEHISRSIDDSPNLVALNEFVITAGPPYRLIKIDISIDHNPGPTIAGDGIIVSTPSGSTAYNVSSGGPIVAPGVNATVITPIAAHSLSSRPIVVPNDSQVRLVARQINSEDQDGTRLLVDGQPGPLIQSGDHVVITKHPDPVTFVVDPSVSYWNTLVRKMHWSKPPTSME
ncbi:MAG: NAD(+)/NADH kinase [Phycisphaerales bacterium]|nr:NAD(+)/NADH kinase [Phycisphaerales bacterium]